MTKSGDPFILADVSTEKFDTAQKTYLSLEIFWKKDENEKEFKLVKDLLVRMFISEKD